MTLPATSKGEDALCVGMWIDEERMLYRLDVADYQLGFDSALI